MAELNGVNKAPDAAGPVQTNGAPADVDDSVEALLDLRTQMRQVQASAKVFETADEVIGFLLDVRA